MKKFYKIFLLLLILIFLSTFNPNKLENISKKNTLFKIQVIEVTNNYLIETDQIQEKLVEIYNKNIFFVKREDLEEPLKDINFLHKIEVKKKYPNTIIIKIFETKPIAIIVKNKKKFLLDSSSKLISFEEKSDINQLPNIFGDGAEKYFLNFFNKLKNNQFPNNKIKNFYYFKIGRWDLQLLDNKIIKLPFNNVDDAIKQTTKLLKREDFKNYNIIDLRVDGKIIVE